MKRVKNVSKYKTQKSYIQAVYRANKDFIDEGYPGVKNKRQAFVADVMANKDQKGKKITSAVKQTLHMSIFVPYQERAKENVVSGLKKFKDEWKAFRWSAGWNKKIEAEKFRYIGDGTYIYDDRVQIAFSNSPEGVEITDVTLPGKYENRNR